MVGLVMILQFCSGVLTAPILLKWADMFNKRLVMIVGDVIAATVMLCWSFFPENQMMAYSVVFIIGTFTSVYIPMQQSLLPYTLKSKEKLDRANAVMIFLSQSNILLGVAGGASLFYWLGMQKLIFMNMGSFIFSAVLLSCVSSYRKNEVEKSKISISEENSNLRSFYKDLKVTKVIPYIIIPIFILQLSIGAINGLEVGYCRVYLQLNDALTGWVMSTAGIGLMLGAALISTIGFKFSPVKGVFFACLGISGCTFMYSLSNSFLQAAIIVGMVGFFNAIMSIKWRSYVQKQIAEKLQARTFALGYYLFNTSMILFMLLATIVADKWNIRTALVVFSIPTILFTVIYFILITKKEVMCNNAAVYNE